jgi:hypothetical protein
VAVWAVFDARDNASKIIDALNQRLQSTQAALATSQAESAALSSVSLESFLKQYNAHVAALNTAVGAYEQAAKLATARFSADGSNYASPDAAGALAGARNDLYAATDNFTHFITLWRAVAEPLTKLLDGNVTALENSKREDNAADVSAAAQRIVHSAPDLATPLRVELDRLKPATKEP